MSFSIDFSIHVDYTHITCMQEEKDGFFFRYHIISENVIFPWLIFLKIFLKKVFL